MMVNLTDGRRDTVEGTKSFVSKNGYTFPVYFDTENNGAAAYNVSSIDAIGFSTSEKVKICTGVNKEQAKRLFICPFRQ